MSTQITQPRSLINAQAQAQTEQQNPLSRQRIGVFGGAFDPPHLGHLKLASTAVTDLNLDTLIFVPTGQAPHKQRMGTGASHRLRMAQLAFEQVDLSDSNGSSSSSGSGNTVKFAVDERELKRTGVSYTIDTLLELKREHPDAHLYLIVGADQARVFDTWHRWTDILQIATLAVAARTLEMPVDTTLKAQNVELNHYRWHNQDLINRIQNSRDSTNPAGVEIAIKLNMPSVPISATQIRTSIEEGLDVSNWLNPAVLSYIRAHSLYSPKSITE